MKRLLAILALTSVFAACNNESASEDAAKKAADSTRMADSIAALTPPAPPAMDTTMKMADTTMKMDSIKK